MKRRPWIWITLFVIATSLLFTLATSWNIVLVRPSRHLIGGLDNPTEPLPWLAILLGTAGFITVLSLTVLLFFRLLREMRLNQLQTEFLARVSHELKTPISTLSLTSSLLRESSSATTPENQELWEAHEIELGRLLSEVERLLEATRWESGVYRPTLSDVRLEDWLQESLKRWNRQLGRDAQLVRTGDPLTIDLRVDARLLELATNNLIDNARKFARERPVVTVCTQFEGTRWNIAFIDEGWGFHPSQAQRIFKRFVRGRPVAPYAVAGTGLGLYLARAACQAMGMGLEGSSRGVGRGAVFRLSGVARK